MTIYSFIKLMKMIFAKGRLPNLQEIEDMGLLAVKIAQHFALRIDFLDERVCRHLSKLYMNTSSLDYKDTIGIAENYMGKGYLNVFDTFDYTPFASASIGQVHSAYSSEFGDVVVKISKGEHKDQFMRDIDKLEAFMKFVMFFYPKLAKVFNPIAILDNIREYTVEELDFNNEIRGMEILKEIQEGEDSFDLSMLAFPTYVEKYSSDKVLVSKRIVGDSFDSLLENKKLKYKKLLNLFHIHGYYIFAKGIFHGDIHPGNIILGSDEKIYFIDNGAISKVEDKMRIGLFYFLKNLSFYDYKECAYHLNYMSNIQLEGGKYSKFEGKFIELYSDFRGKNVSQVSLTKKMMDTIKLGINCGMEFDRGMFPIIKSLMYLDGMVLKCNPKAVLLEDMKDTIGIFESILEKE